MFSFAAVLLFLRVALSQIDQNELTTQCSVYYDRCVGSVDPDCDAFYDNAHAACETEADNHAYGRCMFNEGSWHYLGNYTADPWIPKYRSLALCLVENTKTLGDFTCFNNGTVAVDCHSEIPANMNFNLAPGNSQNEINAAAPHTSLLRINFGSMNIISRPSDWTACPIINNVSLCEVPIPEKVTHMNLHACKMTAEQQTCSALMLGDTQANSTVDLTGNTYADEGDHYLDIVFPEPGTWRLLGHIQIYEENNSTGVRKMWDIANGIELNVQNKIPTPFPTIAFVENERKSGGNNTALIICLTVVALCGGGCLYCYYFGNFGDESYDDEDYEVDPEYDEAADGFVNVGIDEEKEMPVNGLEMTNKKKSSVLEKKPEMDQLAPGGIYAKLMANSTTPTVSREPSPEPDANQPSDLPPAPPAPGNSPGNKV